MSRTVAVVQARMGSSRLPGKVLEDLSGRPVLDWVVLRLQRCAEVTEVVVATTTQPGDDAIVARCGELGVRVVRGSESDVLERYVDAARESDADVVVRITSDCPFVDPDVVDEVIRAMAAEGADYASNTLEPRTFPRGLDVEVMTAAALLEADAADHDPGTREHVTPLLREPGRWQQARVDLDGDWSALRWTVDTAEDLELVRLLAEAVDGDLSRGWRDLLVAWDDHPEWHGINADIEQKAVVRHVGGDPG